MESLVIWYQNSLGQFLPKEIFVFLVSMVPLVELRGGLAISAMLQIPLLKANLICMVGNIIPIPFILLFIRRILSLMKRFQVFRPLVEWLEKRAEKKSKGVEKGEFAFLALFVGIPLPGTGAWTGSLIAALLEIDIKKASVAIFLGLIMAAAIIDIIFYGGLSLLFH